MHSCEEYTDHLVALVDGTLEGNPRERLSEHVERCPACREEYDWLTAAVSDLAILGDTISAEAPEIDLVDAVMQAVEQMEARPRLQSFAPRRPERARSRVWVWAGVTAAAAMLLFASWLGYRWQSSGPKDATRIREARNVAPDAAKEKPDASAETGQPALEDTQLGHAETLLAETKRHVPLRKGPGDGLSLPDLASLTVADVLEARRAQGDDDSALSRLIAWATLSPEAARRLAESAGVSPEALIGASQGLPPEEAEALLRAAVEASPEDPYLRLALAEALSAQAGGFEAASAELRRLSELDPGNALPDYMRARGLLANGDIENGLLALREAGQKQSAYAYSLDAAGYLEDALVGSGMDAETAHLLTAVTAGTDEYSALLAMGEELLRYGEQYEAGGYLDVAQEIYEAVYQLGQQVYSGAALGVECLAGLDLQRMTVDFLEGIYTALDAQASLQWLAEQVGQFVAPIQGLVTFFDALNNFFSDLVEGDFVNAVADIIHQFGDLSLFDRIQSEQS